MTKLNKRPDGGKLLYRLLSTRLGALGAIVLGLMVFIAWIATLIIVPEKISKIIGVATLVLILGIPALCGIWFVANSAITDITEWAKKKVDE